MNSRKNKYIRVFLTFILACFFTSIKAQQNKAIIDSLEIAAKTLQDTELVKVFNELTWQYRGISADKAVEYGNKALQLGQHYHFDKGVAQAYNDLGIIYFDKQDFSKALDLYNKSLDIRKRIDDKKGIAAIYNKIGIIFQMKGDYLKVLEYQQKALDIYESMKYDYGISYSYNNIAVLYHDIGNYSEALKYNFLSAGLKEKIGDTYGLSGSYVNIANIYFKQIKLDTAIIYYKKALELCRKVGDKEYLAANLNNLSSAYFAYASYPEALKYVLESIELRREIDNKYGLISSLENLANIYIKLHQPDRAFRCLQEVKTLSAKIDSKPYMPNYYGGLAAYYEYIGNYKEALYNQKLQYITHDSLLNEDLNSKITHLKTSYETEKKDKEIAESKLLISTKEVELNKEKRKLNILIVGILLICLLAYFLYIRFKYKQKVFLQHEMLKQQELRSKAVIEAEENERQRIAKELHDGIGQLLSAVKLNFSNIESLPEMQRSSVKPLLKNAIDLVDDSVNEIRTISHNMMPNALIKTGLATAVREFLNRIASDKLKIELNVHGINSRLDKTTESILFRVLQEIITNIIKHAQASFVQIQLINHESELTLMVEDNGVGFDPDKVSGSGIGLKNIQSRIEYLNGSLHIDSQKGKGTTITIEIPLTVETRFV